MNEQQKISPKKVGRFAVAGLLVVIFLVALVAASASQSSRVPASLEVKIVNENEHEFIYKKDIEQLLRQAGTADYRTTEIGKLDLNKMELAIQKNPWVVKSDVFVDNASRLQVHVTQRVPVARIFNQNGASWYMDSTLKMLPVSASYAYPAPVFTNVPIFNNDSFGYRFKAKIAYLSSTIINDSFWNAQITQIEVQPDQTFVLVPMLGNQKILFGDTSNVRAKLDNLFAFYKNVSTKIGWDKYQILDARFAGQVVASPAMGYIPPVVKDTVADADVQIKAVTPSPAIAIAKPATVSKPAPAKTEVKKAPAPKPSTVAKKPANSAVAAKPKPKEPAKASKPAAKKEAAKQNKEKGKYIYQGKK